MYDKLKYIVLSLLLGINLSNAIGQDPHFSQFYANSLYLAPSFAGAIEENRFSLNYRNQWPAIPGVFHTYSFSYDRYMTNFRSGIGVLATYDVAGSGDLSNSTIGLLYSYDIQVNQEWHIRPGINFKFVYLGLNYGKLIWNHMITAGGTTPSVTPPPFESVADVDFATSVLAYNDRIWAGFTLDHLLAPRQSFYGDWDTKVPIKVSLFGGYQIARRGRLLRSSKYNEVLSIAANINFQDRSAQSNIGLYYYRDPIIFGLWYRGIPFVTSQAGDAVIALVGIKTKDLHIGYSYDFTISNLIASTGGAHEISLVYEFITTSLGANRRQFHAIPCPEF
ncbi:MAG: type IX secretion system membrane protein PorP/SprF [Bacteroidia bacterium]|nr:MAG: type IX secretion system membrane protein PorP/SprF [Bacteroidia bacterium]